MEKQLEETNARWDAERRTITHHADQANKVSFGHLGDHSLNYKVRAFLTFFFFLLNSSCFRTRKYTMYYIYTIMEGIKSYTAGLSICHFICLSYLPIFLTSPQSYILPVLSPVSVVFTCRQAVRLGEIVSKLHSEKSLVWI